MKCPKCKSDTSITRCRILIDGSLKRRRQCKNCGYEFDTYEFDADNIRNFLEERKLEKENCGFTSNSLCWQCSRATGFCPWSRDFEPVQGWEAVPTLIKGDRKGRNPDIPSYDVKKCPLFIQDRVN